MQRKIYWGILLSVLYGIAAPSMATAQDRRQQDRNQAAAVQELTSALISSSVTSTTTGAGVSLTLVLMDDPATEEVAAYLNDNTTHVFQDIHLGDGEAIRDLGALLAIPAEDHRAFGKLLYELRHDLVGFLGDGGLDNDQAHSFLTLIAEGMNQSDEFSTILTFQ